MSTRVWVLDFFNADRDYLGARSLEGMTDAQALSCTGLDALTNADLFVIDRVTAEQLSGEYSFEIPTETVEILIGRANPRT